MIRGRSIFGSSSSASGGIAKIPLSNCVCARPSTTKSWGLSTTSSCTSIPSALAALCATALKSSVPSNVSMSAGVPFTSSLGDVGSSGACSITRSRLRWGGRAASGTSRATGSEVGFAADWAALPLARANASAASPFIGSAESRRLSHSAASSYRPPRAAISARILSASTFSGSSARTLRNTAEAPGPVFWVVAVGVSGWIAYGQIPDIVGGGRDVVLKVDGTIVRSQPFQQQYQATLEQYRRQQGGGRLSREDERQVQDRVADQFIQKILLDRAYHRFGITVSDDEIIQAARSSPPPQILQQVLQDATFQTNGQFDITKWQRYISSAGPEFASQVEQLYREYLPQRKLEEYLTADLYVSDAKLWRTWRDQHESVTVALLAVHPEEIPDSLAPVSDAELERYYGVHRDDFKRPAAAWLSYVELSRIPSATDSAAARAHARALRDEIAGGKTKFDNVAKRESADSGSRARGGDLGWAKRSGAGFVAPFAAVVRRLTPGVLSEPVLTPFGLHLIRVDSVKGDSVRVRHILVPIALQGAHLDAVDARTDTLDRLAADQNNGTRLDSAAHRLNLPLAHAPKLIEGERLTLGTSTVPDVSGWAFEARPGETRPVTDAPHASYALGLESLEAAGVPPLASIRARVLAAARDDKKKEVARERAKQANTVLHDAGDLVVAGRALGYQVEKLGPFTRVTAPAQFARNPVVLGTAFGLRRGERSGLVAGETGWFVLQALARTGADSAAWLKQRDKQRESLLRPVEQARLQQFIAALRADAKIVDRRSEIFRPAAAAES